ncbi:acetylcholinesterase-like [Fopius arisanus]|uniref:Acetylcholinesterase-like n=1 Tax=Fopius arisanus TaxID=64838 RepID=A0A9R1SZ73_9HYME|nr:PREDICTED: acetylcholinesterase-like [Fopius arisanus]
MWKPPFLLVFLNLFVPDLIIAGDLSDNKRLTDIVGTTKGPVRGEILTTVPSNVYYASFSGIPYGKPPVKDLRFKPPVAVDNWEETFEAVEQTKPCPQFKGRFFGDEDCLYLNIYTPKTTFNSIDGDLRAVVVWIHGGAYMLGSASRSEFGPDFFIEENVVVVYLNYRLGALGFLSLNHPNATGNAALKDQVLALKWVQQNIRKFGGDPTRITIFGHSSAAVLVELHAISDMSRGLYNRSISMSGSSLNPWGLSSTSVAVQQAQLLGSQLSLSTDSTDELLEGLYHASAQDIVMATLKLMRLQTSFNLPFTPTVEDEEVTKDGFLTECTFHKYQKGEFNDFPYLMGFTNAEVAGYFPGRNGKFPGVAAFDKIIERVKTIVNESEVILPDVLKRYQNGRNENLDDWENIINEAVKVTSDVWFTLGIDQSLKYRAKGTAPVYYYRNSFAERNIPHFLDGVELDGVGHTDDLAQIFWTPTSTQETIDPMSPLSLQRKKMVRMWTNFVKFGNPTPSGTADPLLNITWIPASLDGNYLEINANLTMGYSPITSLVKTLETAAIKMEEKLNGCSRD